MLRNLLYLACLFFTQLFVCHSMAQGEFSVSNFNSENGLPQNTVKDMAFDNTGYLWVATENGLLRYDGFLFRMFSSSSDTTLNNRIVRLTCNLQQTLFATDVNGATASIRDGRIFNLKRNRIPIFPDPFYVGISRLSEALQNKIKGVKLISPRDEESLQEVIPLEGYQFILAYKNKLSFYDSTTLVYTLPFPEASNAELFKMDNRVILFQAGKGFYFLQSGKWIKATEPGNISFDKSIEIIWHYPYKEVFAVRNNHLYKLAKQHNGLVANLVIDSMANKSRINCVAYDGNSETYITGTESEGLFMYKRKLFRTMLESSGKKKSYYGQFVLDDNYILTNNGDIIGADSRKPIAPIKEFNNYIITDPQKNVYYAYGDTVFKYDKLKNKVYSIFFDKGSGNYVLDYNWDTLWMINANGIYFHTQDKNYISFKFPPGHNNMPYAIARMREGSFLIGNCLGLFDYYPAKHKIDTVLWMPGKCVRTLWAFHKRVFIGTYGAGWKVWDGKNMRDMPLDSKNYLLYSHCFIRDDHEYLWITTNHGLFKYYIPDVEAYLEDHTTALYSHYYGKEDGLESTEFNGGCYPCYVRLSNGYVSLPNLAGLVWFKPEETEHNLPLNDIIIERFVVDGNDVEILGKHVVIPNSARILRLEIGAPYFDNEISDPLEYRTIGLDTTWKPLSRYNMTIRFNTLPSGYYRVEIRKLQGFGKSYFIKAFEFRVKPPWYLSVTALIGWALLLLLLIRLILALRLVEYRRKQLELEKIVKQKVSELQLANKKLKQNVEMLESYQQELIRREMERSRFIRIISHDIIGPLRFVSMVCKQIEKGSESLDKPYILDSLRDIQETSVHIQFLCTELLSWFNFQKGEINLNFEYFNLRSLIDENFDFFKKIADRRNIGFVSECPREFFIEQDKNVIRIILHNLVSNAINFTSEGEVRVEVRKEKDKFLLIVSDTGKGMSMEKQNALLSNSIIHSDPNSENVTGHGLGILIIRDLIKVTGGSINISSREGLGTTINITWPQIIESEIAVS